MTPESARVLWGVPGFVLAIAGMVICGQGVGEMVANPTEGGLKVVAGFVSGATGAFFLYQSAQIK